MTIDERDAVCPEATCATQEGVDLDAEARLAAMLSTVSFAAGASGVAAALLIWLIDPDAPDGQRAVVVPMSGGGLVGWRLSF
jgi:hypothetical protein